MIARLRASKSRATDELFSAGEAAGTKYACELAEWKELDNLSKYIDSLGAGLASIDFTMPGIARVMLPERANDLVDHVRSNYGTDIAHESWARGFANGVMGTLEDLEDKL